MIPRKILIAVHSAVIFFCTQTQAQSQFQRGMIWEDSRYNALPVYYGDAATLPAAKSLKLFYPRVVIQPKADYTGVAWAAIWNARTAAEAIACSQTDPGFILQSAFSPAYNYGLIRKTPDCNSPISIIDLLESMERNGTPYFSEFREFCPSEVPADLYPLARVKKLSGFIRLFSTTDEMKLKVQSVKNAINASSAVVAGIICPPSFQLAQESWQPREQPDNTYGGHAVCVVGYDDTKFGGAFEVVNTWGKDWGVGGFAWIRYKDFADFAMYGFSLFQAGSTSCDLNFSGEITFRQLTGETMYASVDTGNGNYRFGKSYPSGTSFLMEMKSTHPAYIYSFGVDPSNTLFPLYPRTPSTVPVSFSVLKAPDDLRAITLTDPPGRNYIYFVFSPSQLDLGQFLFRLKGVKDLTPEKIHVSVFGPTLLDAVKWDAGKVRFTANLTSPVIFRVSLDQTRK